MRTEHFLDFAGQLTGQARPLPICPLVRGGPCPLVQVQPCPSVHFEKAAKGVGRVPREQSSVISDHYGLLANRETGLLGEVGEFGHGLHLQLGHEMGAAH
jgi:hypothetical protein